MPKKVITRRQRKAAEAKRQSESQIANMVTSNSKMADLKQSGSGETVDKKLPVKIAQSREPQLQLQPAENVEQALESNSAVEIVVKDKTTQEDKIFLDLSDEESTQKTFAQGTDCVLQPTASANEHGSFSKSLTRRAVATFTKIQKLSKVFNKKMNYKTSPTKSTDPMDLSVAQIDETVKTVLKKPLGSDGRANNACTCEFCKVVINQFLSGKKHPKEKRVCKKAIRRLPYSNPRAVSPGRTDNNTIGQIQINVPKEAKVEEESKEIKTTHAPITTTRRRIIQMLEMKEKRLEKDVLKKIKQLNKQNNKIKATEQLIKQNLAKQQTKIHSSSQLTSYEKHAIETLKKSLQLETNIKTPKLSTAFEIPGFMPKTFETAKMCRPLAEQKMDISSAIQELSIGNTEAPPAKAIGNSGYFILTGTDEQLATQLTNLATRKVKVQNCMVLESAVADKVEQQLDMLDRYRDQILHRMRNKHNMMATGRPRNSKEPSKYT